MGLFNLKWDYYTKSIFVGCVFGIVISKLMVNEITSDLAMYIGLASGAIALLINDLVGIK
jgi:uncharacterized membrane protein YdjX (TVP38/TMEM64 family)